MPGVTRAHGYASAGEFVGRDLWFKTYTKDDGAGGTITQEDLDALVQAIELTSTIEVIGTFTEDSPGQTTVNMVISGANTVDTADALVTDFSGSDVDGF